MEIKKIFGSRRLVESFYFWHDFWGFFAIKAPIEICEENTPIICLIFPYIKLFIIHFTHNIIKELSSQFNLSYNEIDVN
jgi:hypothetical protein